MLVNRWRQHREPSSSFPAAGAAATGDTNSVGRRQSGLLFGGLFRLTVLRHLFFSQCLLESVGDRSKDTGRFRWFWLWLWPRFRLFTLQQAVHYSRNLGVLFGKAELLEYFVGFRPTLLGLCTVTLQFVDIPNHEQHVHIIPIKVSFIVLSDLDELFQIVPGVVEPTRLEFHCSHVL